MQRVHPLPLVLALPAVRAGGAIRAPVALGATERANPRNPAGVGTETERPQRLAQLRRAQGVVAARVRCQQFLQQLYRWVREKLQSQPKCRNGELRKPGSGSSGSSKKPLQAAERHAPALRRLPAAALLLHGQSRWGLKTELGRGITLQAKASSR
ncbi:MAG: hypothetical protein BRC44_12725 [Cyanobacteria bacterium QS_4_48_99]|nr:MAG: hypothetical protein BRC44_12725 [Cyanobacteria bacterium QS_4_48_99]